MANIVLKSESFEVLDSLWAPNSSPPFHGSADMEEEKTPWVCFQQAEKKRRLSQDQVHFLEKSFEVENKLEPERKTQLAKELGLQPRQVAIWFQNRRARYKTKVLEKEYGLLKASYDKLKVEFDTLFKENEKLKIEVNLLGEKLLKRENEKEKGVEGQEEGASSAKSDVLDSDSPHYTATVTATATATQFEEEDGEEDEDDDEDEDDTLSRILMPSSACFPKLEIECCDDLQPNSGNLGFPVQDQGTWFWQF